jgi:CMP-N,N'-diacetyllegionaminic acid synthase
MSKVLGIVPARKGSKGVKNKNKLIINGKPLIEYTINSALKSKIDKLVVSTDCVDIRNISLNLGADSPFLRPKELSLDHSLTIDVVKHCLSFYQSLGEHYDTIILLQPTCPLRTFELINAAIEKLDSDPTIDSVVSVVDVEGNHPFRMKRIENDKLVNYIDLGYEDMRPRQQLPKVYIRSGSIYAIRTNALLKLNGLVGKSVYPIVEKNEDSINIDTSYDLHLFKYKLGDLI